MMGKDRMQTGGRRSIAQRYRQFAAAEDGSILPLSMVFVMSMIMMGGLAVDLMRHEEKRVLLQQTLDRCVLSAASLKQSLDPEVVVTDCFEKAGLSDQLASVDVSEGLNYRTVSARGQTDAQPLFMDLLGVDEFPVKAVSTADERISNVEVSLVLDISGSMSGSRITNLKPAAQSFVDTVMASSDPGKVTISMIPYSAQVNLGPNLMAQFNAPANHSSSYCIELPDSVFGSTALSQTTGFTHNGHFDPFNSSTSASLFNCTPHTSNHVVAISDSATSLKSAIGGLTVGGNTSIDLGVKWGALLLDPSSQPIVQGLISRGTVGASYANRPLDGASIDTLKVLVVMSDGENTTEYKLASGYNTGNSNIWRRSSDGAVWVYHNRASTANDYYNPSSGSWSSAVGTGAVQQTWPQVWARWTVYYVARNLYATPLGQSTSTWQANFTDYVASTKNSRMQEICTAAKNAGIVIYSIAFEAPTGGQTQLKACATSDAHYFNAAGTEIATVFSAIASQISYLRLTQ